MLSIIISVYNVGPYIEECVKSVLELTIPCEAIIVHDEQKDNSFKGDEEYLKDERIIILNRANAGLGIARNQGLEVAKGEYVHFLDGDDKVFADRMERLYHNGRAAGADIICGNFDDTDTPKKCQGPKGKEAIKGSEFLYRYCDTMNTCVWRYIFKKNFLTDKSLIFDSVKYFEDLAFLPRALYQANTIYFEDIAFYYYRYTENTLSNVFNKKRTLDIMTSYNILNNESKKMIPEVGRVLRNLINELVLGTIYYSRHNKGFDLDVIQASKDCVDSMQASNTRERLLLFANNLNWRLFLSLNDAYFGTRILLGKVKQKIKNK